MGAAMRDRRHRRWAAGGFSLLELLFTFVILGAVMLMASRLLVESQLRLSHSARRALEPAAILALKQIRADVRSSARVPSRDFEWNWAPLVLAGHPAGTLRYEKLGSELVRGLSGGPGAGERVVMRGVDVWRWRLVRGMPLPLVEIDLGYRETPRLGLLVAGGQREAPLPVLRRHLISVSPRQAGGKRGW